MSDSNEPSELSFEDWIEWLHNPISTERTEAIENLPNAPDEMIVEQLIHCLEDSNELVRLCAVETLALFPEHPGLRKVIRDFLENETDELALSYALETLGMVGDYEDLAFLMKQFEDSPSPTLSISSLVGLFALTRRVAVGNILPYLEHEEWSIRSAAINSLHFMHRMIDDNRVLPALRRQLERETVGNPKSILETVLADLESE